jgi:D-arabinose 1-dehydrogenase-like Zn-dependent alcohol dehydrogenase
MAKTHVMQVSNPKGAFELVEREMPEPDRGYVRIKVQACGVCHSDALTKEGLWPGIQYPRIPGHEVAGVIDAIGAGVKGWKIGDRAGTGWHGGHCGYCDSCRRGEFVLCQIEPKVNGISVDGGYAEHMIAFAAALAKIPDALTALEAAPLMCAGVTTFNSLRNSGARPGDVVAVLGIGGLGHLGIQFAVKMGFQTIAIARGEDKGPLAKQLGALHYIDSTSQDPAAELQKFGGAKVIVATVTSGKAMTATLGGLGLNGKLLVLGAPHEPLEVAPFLLISGSRSVAGWASGSAIDSQDTMSFSALTGVRSMNEVFPFTRATDAYERMMSGGARFRVVLNMEA